MVLTPSEPEEMVKICACGHMGIISPTTARSSFDMHRRTRTGGAKFRAVCKKCRRQRVNDSTKRNGRRQYLERSEAEDFAVIDAVLAAERAGIPLPQVKPDHANWGARVSPGPFCAWLDLLIADAARVPDPWLSPESRVASQIGINERTLYRYRYEASYFKEGGIRMALMHYVGPHETTFEEMYPDGPATVCEVTSAPVVAPERPAPRCASPGCRELAVGGRFCGVHAERLDRVRAELTAEDALMASNGGTPRRLAKARRSKIPTCCNPSCWEPRYGSHRFCAQCEAEGWTEESYE